MTSPKLMPTPILKGGHPRGAQSLLRTSRAASISRAGPDGEDGIGGGAVAVDVAPDGENGVADEFIDGAIGGEDATNHAGEVFVELGD